MKPVPIPQTEIPNAQLAAVAECVTAREQREAVLWVRDWFAAISRLDKCDDWAVGALSSPQIRSGLVYILGKALAENGGVKQCQDAIFKASTLVDELQSRLAAWHTHISSCTFARRKEVADNRDKVLTDKISTFVAQRDQFRAK